MKVKESKRSILLQAMGALNYRGHKVVADAVVKYLPDNRDVSVLDVAAGTGIVGVEVIDLFL